MGIFGALTTAVTGLNAQSYALENISGNIANSQTVAYKRTETSFQDLVQDASPGQQIAGSVMAKSRSTNSTQGDIQGASTTTFMAVNGAGYFVVQKPTGSTDNKPVFGGTDLFTRRGDFALDRDGYLVNGSGYYLLGLPIDATTGNVVGSVPQVLQFQNGFMPARATTQIEYSANLADFPNFYQAGNPASALLNPATFVANPLVGGAGPATLTGVGAALNPDGPASGAGTSGIANDTAVAAQVGSGLVDPNDLTNGGAGGAGYIANGTTLELSVNGGPTVTLTIEDIGINSLTALQAAINADPNLDGISADIVGGQLRLTVDGANNTTSFTIGGTAAASFGLTAGDYRPTNSSLSSLVASNQTLTLSLGGAPLTTLTFGTGPGQISNRAELIAAIDALPDLTASVNASGVLTITNENGTDFVNDITLSGSDASVLQAMGFGNVTTRTLQPVNLLTQGAASAGQTLTFTIGPNPPLTVTFGTAPGQVRTLADLNAALGALVGGTASVDTATGNITVQATSPTDAINVSGTADAQNFGIQNSQALPGTETVLAVDNSTFLAQSLDGGTITVYDVSGAQVNVTMRWAKVDSYETGGVDTWQLFYLENSNATGTQVAWRNAGISYTFGQNGEMNPQIASVTLPNVTIDGIALGDIQMVHGASGITQYGDLNGTVKTNILRQDGYPAGELESISVNDDGRIVGTYSNGRTLEMAEVVLAEFNGEDQLKKLDGGAFAATAESGPPIYGASGQIIGGALEASNTDIADEFTKLIVTQQAYAANTRIVTTSNEMLQEVINMLR
jgi:flagellar hook protein FlgE